MMVMVVFIFMAMRMSVGAAVMSSVGVIMENAHDDEVANQSEDAGDEHVLGLVDYFLIDHAFGRFDEEFAGDNVDDNHIDQCPEGFSLFPTEGEVGGGLGPSAEPDSP